MKSLILILCAFIAGGAHAENFREVTTAYTPRILVTGPDTFANRLRYWFIMPDGKPSIYYVVEKQGPGRWVGLMHPREEPSLVIKGDKAMLEHNHTGKVVSVDKFLKVKSDHF
ncbi:hypothetical protein [Pseudescherichia sp.]|uniref:hypothetical protein n=1 Tax=Pseudescherichia sp. TaxID=2055881 RepID=UPI0028AB6339|nr:hypothetical protein [Pseudescherichia sp.]